MIRVALAGFGYWGPNLARNIAETPGLELAAVIEPDPARLALAVQRHPGSLATEAAALPWDAVDAVVIATPPSTHYALATSALDAGWDVLVTKPLATTHRDAHALAWQAIDRGRVLMTDHTFTHTGAVRRIADVAARELGRPLYYDSVRVNLGLIQRDINVVWDLAPHDLSIVAAVFPHEQPVEVACVAHDMTGNGQADVAWLTVWHESGFIAHAHLSWLSPVKVRRALIAGDRRMVVYDDMEPSEKVRVYDAGVDIAPGPATHRALVDYRVGDCHVPHLDFTEALRVELDTFADLITVGRDLGALARVKAAHAGVDVVRLLEAADRSIAAGGCRVPVAT